MPGVYTFYDGSVLLKPIEDLTGLEVDKINFVLCMFSSLPIAYYYKKKLSPDKVSRQVRVLVPLLVGLAFCFFCFGRAVKHLLANALISYALMYFTPPKHVHKVVFAFTMSYLLWIHFYRWLILSSYSIDITGPMMVGVQKISTLAFSLHDGLARKPEELSTVQKKEAIKEIPGLLDYMSYIFNFMTGMAGPVNYYADYAAFIDGVTHNESGNITAATKKLKTALFFMLIVIIFTERYPPEDLMKEKYLKLSLLPWFAYWYFSIVFVRAKYYFAWILADSVCNMAGFGYSGRDNNNEPTWNLCTNAYPLRVENGQNLKEVLENWNVQTAGWLRRVAYDRTPKNIRIFATYLLSAVWHGVSIGYYMTFITAALFTPAAATFRRCMRWRFVDDSKKKSVYDLMSNFSTKLALTYVTFPFAIMNLHPAIDVYWSVLFIGHFIAVGILFFLPIYYPPQPKKDGKKEAEKNGKKD